MSTNVSHTYRVFTDGAAKGNPGPGGWGVVVTNGEQVVELGGREERTTNNRMEMTAAITALQFICEHNTADPVTIYTDSSYLVQGITKWVVGWQKRHWQTADNTPVKNADLWQKLVELREQYRGEIDWQLLPGHSGVPGNERTDTIASDFAAGLPVDLFTGSLSDYTIDLSSLAPTHSKKARTSSIGKAYSYLSLVDGVLVRHTDWASCQARVKGKHAQFRKALSPEHEQEILREWGVAG